MHAALEHKAGREISLEAEKLKEERLVRAGFEHKAAHATTLEAGELRRKTACACST